MTKGKVIGVNGNMVTVEVAGDVSMNEVAYVACAGKKLKARSSASAAAWPRCRSSR